MSCTITVFNNRSFHNNLYSKISFSIHHKIWKCSELRFLDLQLTQIPKNHAIRRGKKKSNGSIPLFVYMYIYMMCALKIVIFNVFSYEAVMYKASEKCIANIFKTIASWIITKKRKKTPKTHFSNATTPVQYMLITLWFIVTYLC